MYAKDLPPDAIFYHGTKADLTMGSFLVPGFRSNFAERGLKHIYFAATIEAAAWGAELAQGQGKGRIFIVEPTGHFEDDPNLTDKKYPGNITASYRSLAPLLVVGELQDWKRHSADQIQAMKDGLARLKAEGRDMIIED